MKCTSILKLQDIVSHCQFHPSFLNHPTTETLIGGAGPIIHMIAICLLEIVGLLVGRAKKFARSLQFILRIVINSWYGPDHPLLLLDICRLRCLCHVLLYSTTFILPNASVLPQSRAECHWSIVQFTRPSRVTQCVVVQHLGTTHTGHRLLSLQNHVALVPMTLGVATPTTPVIQVRHVQSSATRRLEDLTSSNTCPFYQNLPRPIKTRVSPTCIAPLLAPHIPQGFLLAALHLQNTIQSSI